MVSAVRVFAWVALVWARSAVADPIRPEHADVPTRIRFHAQAGAAATDPELAAYHLATGCYWAATTAGDAELAIAPCPELTRLVERTRLVAGQAAIDVIRATVLGARGDWRALGLLQGVTARDTEVDATTLRIQPYARAWLMLGVFYGATGRFADADAALGRARRLGTTSNDRETLAWIDTMACALGTWNGDLATAREACDRAQQWVAATGDLVIEMHLTYWQGELAASFDEDEAALRYYQRSFELARGPGGESRRSWSEVIRIAPLVKLGRLAEAERIVAEAETGLATGRLRDVNKLFESLKGRLAYARGDFATAARHAEVSAGSAEHVIRIGALGRLSTARLRLGDRRGARAALEQAIADIEADRATLSDGDSRANYQEVFGAIYASLATIVAADEPERALELAEAGRARALLDAVHDATAIGVAARPLRAAQIRANLAPDELLIEYVVVDDGVLAIAATRGTVTVIPLHAAGDRRALEARVAFFRQLVEQAEDDATILPVAKRLFADVLEPVLAGAPPGMRTLVISPDGPLHGLPFEALYGDGFVLDRWEVVQVPSVSVLARSAQPASGVVVVADPPDSAHLGQLPAARVEAEEIRRRIVGSARVVEGDAATEAGILDRELDRAAILHFATHAVVDELAPRRSALVLGPTRDSDGRWTIDEIYRRKLAADLVVLSACKTGAGVRLRGEGVMSLARAFLQAGASATIATRWQVDDAIGPVFAAQLYGQLAEQPLGAAVSHAKRALRALGAAPRDWAAYVLTGSPRGNVRVQIREPDDHAVARYLLAALGLTGVVVFLARQRWVALGGTLAAIVGLALLTPDAARITPRGRGPARGGPVALPVVASTTHVTWVARGPGTTTIQFFDPDGRLLQARSAPPPVEIPPGARWWLAELRDRGVVVAVTSNAATRPASDR